MHGTQVRQSQPEHPLHEVDPSNGSVGISLTAAAGATAEGTIDVSKVGKGMSLLENTGATAADGAMPYGRG